MRRRRVILAVCVLLVLVCAGLLSPAILRVREAAARATCHSRHKGLACALHNYADAFDTFTGTVLLPTVPPERRLGWPVSLLPFIESSPLYTQFVRDAPADDERNRAATAFRLRYFVCPSSGEHEWSNWQRRDLWKSPTPVTHYVGVAGVGAGAAELPEKHVRAGAFGYDRRTRLTPGGIPDGLSNTFLVVETAHEPGHWAFGGPATVRPFVPDAAPYVGPGRPFGGFHPAEFGWVGPHGAAMTVSLADASIRVVRDTIDPAVLEALATVAGKEPVPGEW